MLYKRTYNNIFIGFITVFVIVGCSRKKDKFLNKNFHSITTKYNYLYNGKILLNDALASLNVQEKDNFWKLLPLEKYNSEEIEKDFQKDIQTPFSQAEEKAALAIQKHSMNINGREENPIMDEAYLLLGKARYYDKRFIPSLEAFNYILFKHPTSQNINYVKIWKEKINLRLGQSETAIVNLKELILNNKLENLDLAEANIYLAQAYINSKSQDSAISCLKTAINLTKNKSAKARYNYILGQLYDEFNYKDSATTLYNENISYKRKIPREFLIHSYIKRTNNTDSINNSIIELQELVENIENKPFLGSLFHQLALLNLRMQKDSIATKFFNKSLESILNDEYLETMNYQKLAEINFDNNEYLMAGLYYDSTLIKLEKKTKLYRQIKKKRDNLKDVILYENITKNNDSILALVNMNNADREEYFKLYIDKLKRRDEKLKESEKKTNFGSQNVFDQQKKAYDEAVFYFYNPSAVAYGKSAFTKKWGKRKLVNNWRWSVQFEDLINKEKETAIAEIPQDSIYNINYYLNKIPKSSTTIDSLKLVTNDAYYKLGAIYKDQFREFEISNQKLTRLLSSHPETSLIPPAKYSIYKNYISLNEQTKAMQTKEDIIINYPTSKYAEFLLNPETVLLDAEDNPTEIYNTIYEEYNNKNYINVIDLCDINIKKLYDSPILPKIEMLKAVSIAKEFGYIRYTEQLKFIKLNYSNSIEAKEAEFIIKNVLPLLSSTSFLDNEKSENFKILYQFSNTSLGEIESFVVKINESINEIEYLELNTSKDYYNNIVTFVVLHGLKSYDGAMGLAEMLNKKSDFKNRTSFVVSSENYKTIQIHKNLEEYLK
tara:strand:+ start:229 stop:2727 length:2499 start_codon:yes stop_codon:yes gene_type:complete